MCVLEHDIYFGARYKALRWLLWNGDAVKWKYGRIMLPRKILLVIFYVYLLFIVFILHCYLPAWYIRCNWMHAYLRMHIKHVWLVCFPHAALVFCCIFYWCLAGILTDGIDERAMDALKELSVEQATEVLEEFKKSNLEHVTNKSAFICGLMKTCRQKHGVADILASGSGAASRKPGPDEAKLKVWVA